MCYTMLHIPDYCLVEPEEEEEGQEGRGYFPTSSEWFCDVTAPKIMQQLSHYSELVHRLVHSPTELVIMGLAS